MLPLHLFRAGQINSGRMFSSKITHNGTSKSISTIKTRDKPFSYEWKNPHQLYKIYKTSFKSITNITLNESIYYFEEEDNDSIWLLWDDIKWTLAWEKEDPCLKLQDIEILTEISHFLKTLKTKRKINNCIKGMYRSMPEPFVPLYKEYFKTKASKERAEYVISEELKNMNLVIFDIKPHEYLSVILIEKLFNASVKLGYNKYDGHFKVCKKVNLIVQDEEFQKNDGGKRRDMLSELEDLLFYRCNRVFGRGQFRIRPSTSLGIISTLVVFLKDRRQLKDLRVIINSLNDSSSYRYHLCDDEWRL